MTKTEMLFIRACKVKDSSKRITSVYRRFYGKFSDVEMQTALVNILSSIVDKYNKPSVVDVISACNPHQYIYSDIDKTYEGWRTIVLFMLINNLRFLEASKLPEDFIKPLQFRRKDV